MKKPKSALLLVFFVCLFVFVQPVEAARRKPRWLALKNKPLVTFSWGCATTDALPKRELDRLLDRTLARKKKDGGIEFADRAFRLQLFPKGPEVYFVPLTCGATGNCVWAMFSVSPRKYLGEIHGQYFYTTISGMGWPMIVSYGHISSSQGELRTFEFRNGHYCWIGDSFRTDEENLSGNRPRPSFFENARQLCRDYGT
jgi:hypothetical protein